MCWIKLRKPEVAPVIRREISGSDLNEILNEKLKPRYIRMSDDTYKLCDISDVEAFLEEDQTNHIKYESQITDCDDFAWMLLGKFSTPPWSGLAFGFIWTFHHAVNVFIDTNLDIWIIEPQTDQMERAEDYLADKIVSDLFV